jgi:hypothetical protein
VLGRAHDAIGVGNAAHVLHGAELIVRAHDMIDLREGVAVSVGLLVEIQSGLSDTSY